MSKIAMIGSEYIFKSFKALSIEVLKAENPLEARRILEDVLPKKSYPIIFMTEELANESLDLIAEWNESTDSTIVLIPGTKGGIGIASERISLLTKRAIGADVLARK